MLSTILFINEQPVGYTVKIDKDKCYFTPTEFSQSDVDAPSFSVVRKETAWEVTGLSDQRVIDQLYSTLPAMDEAGTKLSAAP